MATGVLLLLNHPSSGVRRFVRTEVAFFVHASFTHELQMKYCMNEERSAPALVFAREVTSSQEEPSLRIVRPTTPNFELSV